MLSSNLTTYGVTKTVSQTSAAGGLYQISQLRFGQHNVADIKTTIDQVAPDGKIIVSTQTLATPNEEFVRYLSIDAPIKNDKQDSQKIDFQNIVNKWGRSSQNEGGGSTFAESLYGLVLFGNLPGAQRQELLNVINQDKVYQVDFNNVESINQHGRRLYVYKVDINVTAYAKMLKVYDSILGLKRMSQLNPAQYVNEPSIKATFTVDRLNHQLIKVEYDNHQESYSGYGLHKPIKMPTDYIGRLDLERELQAVLSNLQ